MGTPEHTLVLDEGGVFLVRQEAEIRKIENRKSKIENRKSKIEERSFAALRMTDLYYMW
jgi:hypothetical protein